MPVYKIGYYAPRQDARRHLLKSFKAENDNEARAVMVKELHNRDLLYRWYLYTGDWKPVPLCSLDCNNCPDYNCSKNKTKFTEVK